MAVKISVIIPTYKPREYLWECLRSLKMQTLDSCSFEVLLVLNGDPNPYYNDIQNFIESEFGEEFNVKLFYSSNAGVSAARNVGLDNADGDYITFIDDDDVVSEDYLKGLLEKATQSTISISNTKSFTESINEPNSNYVLSKEYLVLKRRGKMPFTKASKFFQGPCMKLINRNIISDRRFDLRFKNGEDSLFMFLISDKMISVDFASPLSVYYRRIRHDGANYSKKPLTYKIHNAYNLIIEYCMIFFKHPTKYKLSFLISRIAGAVKSGLFA